MLYRSDHGRGGHRGHEADEEAVAETVVFRGLVRYEQQSPIRQVSYYLCGDILEPQYYTELFYTLRTATDTDLVYLHLNSSGGDFNTGLQIINNIVASQAQVVTILEARAYSMAALIFLCGDKLIVHDNCQLMFHIYSGYFSGKGNEQQAEVLAISSWFEKVMARICMPFLSEGEINRILKGSDLWMDSDEIRHRLLRMQRVKAPVRPRAKKAVPAKGVEPPGSEKK
ncbi:Clp protease ClpP [Propionivibrio limicola]|uniref:Clp protease ClpP n=1 Tax=Propionivibrio limicola TaxID=167645 RepID=UPI0012921B60|nr:Clp protease ClpP [Propionivibrio limicola]